MESTAVAPRWGIGAKQVQPEGPSPLTGEHKSAPERDIPGSPHAVFVRDPIAHAHIETAESAAAPKMTTTLTGEFNYA